MGVEHVLDLPRPDLEAGGVDHVLLAVDDVEPAVGVHESDVAGAQFATGEGLGGLRGQTPVARYHLGPADGYLAGLAEGHLGSLLVEDADHGVGAGQAHGEGAGGGVDGGFEMHGHAGAGGGALGEAVAVAEVEAEGGAQALDERGRERRRRRRSPGTRRSGPR